MPHSLPDLSRAETVRDSTEVGVDTGLPKMATDAARTRPDETTDGFARGVAWLLALGGLVGFAASFILLVEKFALLENPAYVQSCSSSPLFSCGSVLNTPQAAVFGFPNPILGVAGFAVVTTVGMALLAGAMFRRWFWVGLQTGVTLGVLFTHWMIFQSLYRLGALCPYCMVVWAVTIPIFWYTTLHNVRAGHLPVPALLRRAVNPVANYHGAVLTGWFILLVALILKQFWTYWSGLVS
jgi:uncharacterized membrane protein